MNREEMKRLILAAVSKKLGSGYHGTLQTVLKTNLKLDGLSIFQDGSSIASTIYLEPFYQKLEKGISIDDVAEMILKIYLDARDHSWQFDIMSITDFDRIRDRLYAVLINRHSNTELLRDVPHRLFLDDLAIVVRCLIEAADDGNADFLVHDSHLKLWGTDKETLLSHAIKNTRKLFGVKLQNMEYVIRELIPCMETGTCRVPMWILSNCPHMFGASAVLFHDVILSILVDTFFTRIFMPKQHPEIHSISVV